MGPLADGGPGQVPLLPWPRAGPAHLFLLVFQIIFPLDFSDGGLDVVFRIGDPGTLRPCLVGRKFSVFCFQTFRKQGKCVYLRE